MYFAIEGEAMSYIDERIERAADWFRRHLMQDESGYAGWGWSTDVSPNPQDTAEVVCALRRVGSVVPEADAVLALVRRNIVRHSTRGDWSFHAPIDVAWRLRALRILDIPSGDADVRACRDSLLANQDPDTGGWVLGEGAAPVSVTATVAAILALREVADDGATTAPLRATIFLVRAVLDGDPRVDTLYAAAQIGSLLAVPEIAELGGTRVRKARAIVTERMLTALDSAPGKLEEEPIRRGQVAQTWHHATLQLSVAALATSGDRIVFHPTFRRAFVDLLDFQQLSPVHLDRGGFRTSREGFVTSFATAQAIHALAQVRSAVGERVNPARVFDMLCRRDGEHHTDPQTVVPLGTASMVMNSPAGAACMVAGGAAGATIITLALIFADPLGDVASRALVAWGIAFVFLGIYGFAATRLNTIPKGRVGAVVFAAFTAVVFPVVSFLLG